MAKKLKKDEVIEGKNAYMYAKLTSADMEAYKQAARHISEYIDGDARILEVAPGPGYTMIERPSWGNLKLHDLISASHLLIWARETRRKQEWT